jgi:hypothetical protein
MEAYKVRYRGPERAARQLVSDLEAGGFQVRWQSPSARGDVAPGQVVVLGMRATYPDETDEAVVRSHLARVVDRFLARVPEAKVDVADGT